MGEVIATARGSFLVEVTGPRQPRGTVVLVAGLGDDHTSWAQPAEILSEALRCVTFDNRGIGASPVTPGPYRIPDMAEDAHQIVTELGLGTVCAVGSSMGGAICQEWALAHPEQIDRLVLSNTWAAPDPWLTALFEHWIELAGHGSARDLLFQLALFCLSPGHFQANPDTVAEFLDAPVPNLDGFRAAARACQRHDSRDRLARLRAPTLIVGGEYDILTRPALSRDLAAAIPEAELSLLPTGHMIFWEEPEEWTQQVCDFIR